MLRLRSLLWIAVLVLVLAARAAAIGRGDGPVVINEFSYDDIGTDDREFVEFYNRSRTAVDLSGWQLVAEDALGQRGRFVVPRNTTLGPGQTYVMGSALVPGVDQVIGTTDIFENAQEALVLLDASNKVVDAVVFESWRSSWRTGPSQGEGVWPEFVSRDAAPTSWSRVRDGYDSKNARDFRIVPATPGRSNDLKAVDVVDDFDARKVGEPLPLWGASFEEPRVIDPRLVDRFNPSKLPPSPQGGNAAVFWDPRGGGNACMLLADVRRDVVFEAYVWIDARPLALQDRAAWSVGVQGGTGSYYDFPDASGSTPQFSANGNTGVAWTYEADDQGASLYLYEHGDGGWGRLAKTAPRLLGKIALQPVRDTGWRRLRLEVRQTSVEAYFGGTPSCADGIRFAAQLTEPATGGIYVGYRERIAKPSHWRPFTCDALRVVSQSSAVNYFGAGLATTHGLPRLRTNVAALAGSKDFRVLASGLVPNGQSITVFGLRRLPLAVDLSVIGARRGALLHVQPDFLFPLVADARGDGSVLLPIPCHSAAVGADLFFQTIDFDPRLPSAFPIGTSRAMVVTVGR